MKGEAEVEEKWPYDGNMQSTEIIHYFRIEIWLQGGLPTPHATRSLIHLPMTNGPVVRDEEQVLDWCRDGSGSGIRKFNKIIEGIRTNETSKTTTCCFSVLFPGQTIEGKMEGLLGVWDLAIGLDFCSESLWRQAIECAWNWKWIIFFIFWSKWRVSDGYLLDRFFPLPVKSHKTRDHYRIKKKCVME